MHLCIDGWPNDKSKIPAACLPFWTFRDEISFNDGVLFKGEKVIIPRAMQPEMLKLIHGSHLGIDKCKRRARDVLYWPGMASQIENIVSSCATCSIYQRRNQKEPLLPHDVPDRPWAKVGADLFEIQKKQFLVLVDYYSGYIEVDQLTSTTASQVIMKCKSQFSRHGIPDVLITDNGPQFSSYQFRGFTQEYQFNHRTSSPYHPQSNGMAEKAVQTVKRLMTKAAHDGSDLQLALLEYRNTPWSDTIGSPVQRLMGRRTKTLVPTTGSLLKPQTIDPSLVQKELVQRRQQQKHYYDQHAKPLKQLKTGDSVLVSAKDGKWKPAKVTSLNERGPRSYNIVTPQGHQYRRNRKDLRNLARPVNINAYDDDFLDDYNPDTSEPVVEPQETQPPAALPTLRCSQRTVKTPVRYANELPCIHCAILSLILIKSTVVILAIT